MSIQAHSPSGYFNQLNQDYLKVHSAKEALFWTTLMATSDDHQGAADTEKEWTKFISNANRIAEIKQQLKTIELKQGDNAQNDEIYTGLQGWLSFFSANAIESPIAQQQKSQLIQMESELQEKRQAYSLEFIDEQGNSKGGSLPELMANIKTSNLESVRKSSHHALLNLEQWVLNNGFIELIKARNQFAKLQGFDNFFDYSIVKTERMTTEQLFTILDDFEVQTRERNNQSLAELAVKKGEDALKAHNLAYSYAGDAMRALDPYVPFKSSVRRWVESFGRLNIQFSQAELTLDLLNRDKKYQNGFCHGPVPSFYEQGKWIPAKVNFTSNASPDQVGSGYSGIQTLFHEGGHAAHFSNVKMNAPCFSQEFAPTSMAYAETQSMFCDSLLEDADWLKRYATNENGDVVPEQVIESMVASKQPFKALEERSILVVPYFESALYRLKDAQLTPEVITSLARQTEKKILGLDVSPRPLLAIPHLLSNEAACSYQGYLLANMAVYQTRAYFMASYGYLTDNPKIGPALAEAYWKPGNSLTHDQTIYNLTGEHFNAKYLADACNHTVEQAWNIQLDMMSNAINRNQEKPEELDAKIKIVDGDKLLASNDESTESLVNQFESYIEENYALAR